MSQIDRLAFLLQFGATTVLVLLFGVVTSRVARQPWLNAWSRAWGALWVAILAVTLRFDVLLPLTDWGVIAGVDSLGARLLELIYVGGKLAFFLLLADGALLLARGTPVRKWVRATAIVAAAMLAVLMELSSPTVDDLVKLQAIVAVPLLIGSALVLGTRPRRQGDYGTRMLAGVFGVLALLWMGYYYGLAEAGAVLRSGGSGSSALLRQLLFNNSVVDALLELLLGYGMVLVVSEELSAAQDQQRRSQLAALASSENRLTRTIEAALDAILTLDADFRIVQANHAAGTALGVPPSRLIGESFLSFLPPELAEQWRTDWQAAADDALPAPSRHRFRGRRGTGGEFPAEATLAPIGPDRAAGCVLVLRDETEAERTSAERERLRQRLSQSQRVETVGQLVSSVAQELNNPLAAILAFTEELKHGQMGQAEAEALTTIEQQALRCRGIVRDLLKVARKREVRLRPVEPRQLLQRVLRGFEPTTAAAQLSVQLHLPDAMPNVIGDETALEQILANLITNALQASPPQGRVVVEALVADSERLVITIDDEGSGFTADVQARLFEPFFTTKPAGEGAGLGLAVSRGLVEQLGGTLALENRQPPHHGARAVISLPLAKPGQFLADGQSAQAVAARGLGRRALVIDDETSVRAAVRRYLERMGWQVDDAADGRVALERLTAVDGDEYAAIICDLRMPRLSGIELHDLLAATHPQLLKRIIIMTGDITAPHVVDFLGRTWAPVLEKPFDLSILGAALGKIAPADVSNSQSLPIS